MKKSIVILATMLICSVLHAAEKKRPSWSQGLPERTENTTPQIDINKPDLTQTSVKDLKRTPAKTARTRTQPETKPQQPITFKAEPMNTQAAEPDTPNNELSPITIIQSKPTSANKEIQYPWHITRMTAVTAPPFWVTDYPTVQIDISINPQGRVHHVSISEDHPIPQALLLRIKRSLMQWRFTAPEDYGVQQTITRPFKIQLQTDHS